MKSFYSLNIAPGLVECLAECMFPDRSGRYREHIHSILEDYPSLALLLERALLKEKWQLGGISSLVNTEIGITCNSYLGIEKTLIVLGACIFQARLNTKNQTPNLPGVFLDLSLLSKPSPVGINGIPWIETTGEGWRAIHSDYLPINTDKLATSDAHSMYGNARLCVVGMGGGSDCLQAANLAQEFSANPVCAISIRTLLSSDEPGQYKAVENAENLGNGVFKITPQSKARGNFRFIENFGAEIIPMYLVLDEGKGRDTLCKQLGQALAHAGGADIVVGVDTGGDALYRVEPHGLDKVHTTPDQDQQALEALVELGRLENIQVQSAILACGVDTPPYAEDVLQAAGAKSVGFSEIQKERIIARYDEWRGRAKNNFLGKTPLALAAALEEKEGLVCLDLPPDRVLSKNNPWNPFVCIENSMSFVLCMDANLHLEQILSGDNKILDQVP